MKNGIVEGLLIVACLCVIFGTVFYVTQHTDCFSFWGLRGCVAH